MREVHCRLFVGVVFEVGEEGDGEDEDEGKEGEEGVYHGREETGVEEFEEDEDDERASGVEENSIVAEEGGGGGIGRSGRGGRSEERHRVRFCFLKAGRAPKERVKKDSLRMGEV
jgi:hypothetical protein